jgi:hypothetical protein
MAFPKKIGELCSPAFIYLVLSVITLLIIFLQNLGINNNVYTLGSYKTNVVNKTLIFIVKIIYILFWTWILNLICKDGHKEIAWFLVALPFVLGFLMASSTMNSYGGSMFEGMASKTAPKKKMPKK